MVKITNGTDVFDVSEGAYDGTFKQQGYSIITNEAVAADVIQEADADVCDELDEKPVSKWTKQELKQYCDKNGISLSGVTRTEDVRKKVLAFQEQNLAEE